jgi:hypothetical protein
MLRYHISHNVLFVVVSRKDIKLTEKALAESLRKDSLEHASEEDRPFFERMDDRAIIERILICSVCERPVLAYQMAIMANTGKELDGLIAQFADQAHLAKCVPIMMKLGPEGLSQLKIHREEQEMEQFSRDVAEFQGLFEQHKHELLDIMEDRDNSEE